MFPPQIFFLPKKEMPASQSLPFLGQPDSQIRSFRASSSAPQKPAPFSWLTRLANPLFQSFLFCSAEASSLFLANQTRKSALSELSLLLRRSQLPFLGQPDSQIRSFRASSSAPQKPAPFSWPTRLANPLFQSFLFCSAEEFAR